MTEIVYELLTDEEFRALRRIHDHETILGRDRPVVLCDADVLDSLCKRNLAFRIPVGDKAFAALTEYGKWFMTPKHGDMR